MKRFLKFLFNTARTISLILVLGFLGLSTYLSLYPEKEKQLFAALEKYEAKENQRSADESEGAFGIMAIDEPSLENYEAQKIRIPVKGGAAYLRPSQIMYMEAGPPVNVVMNNDSTIVTRENLSRLEQILQNANQEYFFRTKSNIINCSYVLQFTNESSLYNGNYSYQHVAKMQDGKLINVSRQKADELSELLDQLSF